MALAIDRCARIINSLLDMSADEIRLMAGEIGPEEMQTIRAVLRGIKARFNYELHQPDRGVSHDA